MKKINNLYFIIKSIRDDSFFQPFLGMNVLLMTIPLLYMLMLISIINPKKEIEELIVSIGKNIVKPFDYLDDFIKESNDY